MGREMTAQPLSPCPALWRVLADLAHDWRMRAYRTDLTVSAEDAETYARSLADLATSAKLMFETFERVIAERNQLLAIARDADLIAVARAGAPGPVPIREGNVIDLSALFAREQAVNHPTGGAA